MCTCLYIYICIYTPITSVLVYIYTHIYNIYVCKYGRPGVLTVGTMGGRVGATVTGRTPAKGDLGGCAQLINGVYNTKKLIYDKYVRIV